MYQGISKQGVLAVAMSVGLGCLAGGQAMLWSADDPSATPKAGPTPKSEETVSGKVKEFLRNDRNDVDGLRLENGREVHFPPHLAASVMKLVQPGDEITVRGAEETRPRGEVVFELSRIECRGEKLNIDRPEPPLGPAARTREEAMNATGKIREFASNRHGDVDGLLLIDGTEVKLPPHQGRELQDLVKVGDEVRVEGRRHETPRGDIHLHADRITAVGSGRSIERDGPGRPGHVPPHEREHGPRGRGPGARPAPPHEAQFEEILKELREVRRLLEAQQSKS